MAFAKFNRATKRETPNYLDAEIQRANAETYDKQMEKAQRYQNYRGAAELYNAGMTAADKSPISDALRSMFAGEETTAVDAGVDMAAEDAITQQAIDMAGEDVITQQAIDMAAEDAITQGVFDAAAPSAVDALAAEAGGTLAAEAGGTLAAETAATATAGSAGAGTAGAGAAGSGAMTGAGAAMPYVAAILAADQLLFDGEGMEGIGGFFGKLF